MIQDSNHEQQKVRFLRRSKVPASQCSNDSYTHDTRSSGIGIGSKSILGQVDNLVPKEVKGRSKNDTRESTKDRAREPRELHGDSNSPSESEVEVGS